MSPRVGRWAGRALLVALGLVALGAVWEAYKSWGPVDGVKLFGAGILPRTTDAAMPHRSTIWHAFGMVGGLKWPTAVHIDYFRCSAAGWWNTFVRLKLPASVPFLVPSLRRAAPVAVIGTIVAEISTGLDGGIGRLIITYSQQATGDPSRVYAAVIGAAGLGLFAAAVVTVFDAALWR